MAIDTQKNNLLSNTKSRAELAELLDITDKSLIYFLYRRPVSERYLSFEIPKKNGGVRVISTPASHLKVAQKKLSDLLYEIYVPYLETHGFVKNKSILSNAKMHVSANKKPKWVLNIDIKDFFSAINFGRVYKLFLSPPYSFNKEISTLLAQICCHENKLPQGAPSSPIISNLICRRLDRQLRKIARDNSCEYSRYADDITFSSKKKYFPKSIAKLIENDESKSVVKLSHELHYAIKSNGFELNFEKLRLAHHSQHLEVTGLTVNEKPNVNREYVRELRSMLHAWEKYGLENAQKVFNEKFSIKVAHPKSPKPAFRNVLDGKLNFLRMVKGFDDPVYSKLRRKFELLDPKYKGVGYHNLKARLYQSTWVVESDTCEQGTGFWLKGYGFVTCAHVLQGSIFTVFNHADTSNVKFEAKILKIDIVKDVAILSVEKAEPEWQLMRSNAELTQGAEVKIAGFPSYDNENTKSINITTAKIIEKRLEIKTKNPIWRVAAQISSGSSGGPVLNDKFQVVGIACRGSSCLTTQTEDTVNGVLPISQLDSLN